MEDHIQAEIAKLKQELKAVNLTIAHFMRLDVRSKELRASSARKPVNVIEMKLYQRETLPPTFVRKA
jgi:hypothetical protein